MGRAIDRGICMCVYISDPCYGSNPTPHTPRSPNKPHRRGRQQHGQGGGAVVTTRRLPPPFLLLPPIIPIPTNAAVWVAAAAGGGGEESPPPMGEGGLAAAFGKGKGEISWVGLTCMCGWGVWREYQGCRSYNTEAVGRRIHRTTHHTRPNHPIKQGSTSGRRRARNKTSTPRFPRRRRRGSSTRWRRRCGR